MKGERRKKKKKKKTFQFLTTDISIAVVVEAAFTFDQFVMA